VTWDERGKLVKIRQFATASIDRAPSRLLGTALRAGMPAQTCFEKSRSRIRQGSLAASMSVNDAALPESCSAAASSSPKAQKVTTFVALDVSSHSLAFSSLLSDVSIPIFIILASNYPITFQFSN